MQLTLSEFNSEKRIIIQEIKKIDVLDLIPFNTLTLKPEIYVILYSFSFFKYMCSRFVLIVIHGVDEHMKVKISMTGL